MVVRASPLKVAGHRRLTDAELVKKKAEVLAERGK